jgi:hypothetical protein
VTHLSTARKEDHDEDAVGGEHDEGSHEERSDEQPPCGFWSDHQGHQVRDQACPGAATAIGSPKISARAKNVMFELTISEARAYRGDRGEGQRAAASGSNGTVTGDMPPANG